MTKTPGESPLETALADQLMNAGIPFTREYQAIPGRRYRWDFAIGEPETTRILVEVQGGTWSRKRTGHSTGAGIKRDCEKLNLATEAGYRSLQFTSDMVKSKRALYTIKRIYNHGHPTPSGK